ncbi:hypothetical protein JMF89_06590 [Clostridiaceae bacterium UIB06]|uniref:Uncharacterized protein n=1 Tax=Clostridium thailandense TaxID=2794346 RepID=A0A949TM71_9CLOT|nr:hypothetical protein [Clostridium thailandense]MBV7271857.1 hypothetical protein [Clostridium thailandense]MCH5136870.1 hypothetical protein [Clostridiaceae bacterium UIB06]
MRYEWRKAEKEFYLPKERPSLVHREIYLSDARKIERDKLKTVLRYMITKQ